MASTEVYVAAYQTEHDVELRVFALEEQAWEWRDAVAREAWTEDFSEEIPVPDFEVGQKYFDMAREFEESVSFTVQPATIDWPQ